MSNPMNASEPTTPGSDEQGAQYQDPLAAESLGYDRSRGNGVEGSEGIPLAQPIPIAPSYRRSLFRR